MTARRRNALVILAATALLVSTAASAREVRLQGPNGESGLCPTAAAEAETDLPQSQKRAAGNRGGRPKAAPMVRNAGDGSDAVARPRWHSFLPGMFR